MRINTNISSLVAQENVSNINKKLQSSLEKLSSGLKINKASDDASGLAIADKLRTQATSIKQGIANGNSAVSLLQIADKSMAEQSNILDIVKSKLIQANTDTTSQEGREAIRKDIKKLLEQLDNIATQTNYNGLKLLEPTSKTTTETSTVNPENFSLTSQKLNAGDTYNGLVSDAVSYDLTFTADDYKVIDMIMSGTGGTITNNGNGALSITVYDGSDTDTYLASLGSDVVRGTPFGSSVSYSINNGYDVNFGENSFDILALYNNNASDSYSYSGGVITSLKSHPISVLDMTISGTYTTTTESTTATIPTTTVSSGLSFQIGERSDDIIKSSSIQANTLGLGGGNEALDQTTGSATRNNQIEPDESLVFSIGNNNSATIDAESGVTNVTISGEVETLNFNGTSGTISNLDETTYELLNNLVLNTDGTTGSETLNGVTVSLSNGATISKSGGTFTLSNGGSLTFSDGYEIISADIKESNASGTIIVTNATELLVTNLSSSANVNVTSSASGSLIGGQTLISLKNLAAGELTKEKAERFQMVVDAAISALNSLRGEIGSTQNQVESAVRNLMTQYTNVKAAESIIRDVDYAQETSNFNKLNIISQAGSFAISQANNIQQNVLRLLS